MPQRIPKNQKKSLRKIVAGKTCRFCGAELSTHLVDSKPCAEAQAAGQVVRKQKKFMTSGAFWLAMVKALETPANV
jgi:hypothetical protein